MQYHGAIGTPLEVKMCLIANSLIYADSDFAWFKTQGYTFCLGSFSLFRLFKPWNTFIAPIRSSITTILVTKSVYLLSTLM